MNGEGYNLLYSITFGRNYMFSGANDGSSSAKISLQFFQNLNLNNFFLQGPSLYSECKPGGSGTLICLLCNYYPV